MYFNMNPYNKPHLAVLPGGDFIYFKNDRGTKYVVYIEVYNELKAAYNELWEEESMTQFGEHYSEDLAKAKKDKIKAKIPFVLSEAEATTFGDESK